ncbi:Fc receptor-like protein 4 [Haemorhous mexicanus]|uniref:Fc receptor-like protein 4 n=1 Tax=Haemorhous mexicanus TaxID=30427 RepID=UPI0028BEACCE|nr:Fc receptor-like protein 4 [Haemorhous mexicanus]
MGHLLCDQSLSPALGTSQSIPVWENPVLELGTPGAQGVTQWGVLVPSALTGPLCPTDWLALQVPARAQLEGDTVTLRCRGWQNRTVTRVSFYREREKLRGLHDGTELSLSPLQLSHSGNYSCKGLVGSWVLHVSAPATVTVQARLELQVSARELLEGDTVTLRCLRWQNNPVTGVQFYHGDQEVGKPLNGTELSLSPLQLNDSGNYSCEGRVDSGVSLWAKSAPVTVTVHGEHPLGWNSNLLTPPKPIPKHFSLPVLEGPPEPSLGSPLTLSCLSTPSPLRPPTPLLHVFYRDGQVLGGPQVSPQLLVPSVGVSHSGNYSCQVRSEGGSVRKSSARLRVTVRMPVANATITPGPLAHQVHPGDNVTLHCSVQVGSAPVTFTWLHNGQEVARGPLLELRDIDVGHSGTYQCVATNQLGQDGHRVFRAFSPELAMTVKAWGHRDTVAAGVGGALLFLLLLVGVIVAWHWWHLLAARKNQERAPPDPLAAPEEGQVLYTHVVVSKRAGGEYGGGTHAEGHVTHECHPTQIPQPVSLAVSPRATTLQDPQVTYAELRGHQGRPRKTGDICGNVL